MVLVHTQNIPICFVQQWSLDSISAEIGGLGSQYEHLPHLWGETARIPDPGRADQPWSPLHFHLRY